MSAVKVNWNPTRRELRMFSLSALASFGILAGLAYGKTGAPAAAIIITVGLLIGVIGCAAPAAIRPVYLGWMGAVFPIAWLMSHAILAVVFYFVFTPVGLLMRALGRDPMKRSFDRAAKTYWLARPSDESVGRYFRQY
jgi:hypothetical protein